MGKRKPKKKQKPVQRIKNFFSPGAALALFVIFIMVGSTIGYVMMGPSPGAGGRGNIEYEDHVFSMTTEGYWVTEYQNSQLRFHNLPGAVENIDLPQQAIENIAGAEFITITFHPEDDHIEFIESSRFELEEQIGRKLGMMTQTGVIENVTPYEDVPVMSCEDATVQNPVIEIRTGEEKEISFENNCLKLVGETGPSLHRMKDRLIYSLTGIIED